jgi:hypothetical protein
MCGNLWPAHTVACSMTKPSLLLAALLCTPLAAAQTGGPTSVVATPAAQTVPTTQPLSFGAAALQAIPVASVAEYAVQTSTEVTSLASRAEGRGGRALSAADQRLGAQVTAALTKAPTRINSSGALLLRVAATPQGKDLYVTLTQTVQLAKDQQTETARGVLHFDVAGRPLGGFEVTGTPNTSSTVLKSLLNLAQAEAAAAPTLVPGMPSVRTVETSTATIGDLLSASTGGLAISNLSPSTLSAQVTTLKSLPDAQGRTTWSATSVTGVYRFTLAVPGAAGPIQASAGPTTTSSVQVYLGSSVQRVQQRVEGLGTVTVVLSPTLQVVSQSRTVQTSTLTLKSITPVK